MDLKEMFDALEREEPKIKAKPKAKIIWWHYIILIGIILFITALIINSSARLDYDYTTETYTIREGFGEDIATVQLIENTDQCLTNCYAVIWIQPHINISLKDKSTLLNFYDKKGKSKTIENRIVEETTEEYTKEIFDKYQYCEKEEVDNITLKKVNKTYPCGSLYKNETFERKKQAEFSLDSELEEGKDYYVRIEGKKKPSESVEWILTFYGSELDAWAWWDSNWLKCRNLTYTAPATDDLTDYPVNFSINSSALIVGGDMEADGVDVRIVNRSCVDDGYEQKWVNITSFNVEAKNTTIYHRINGSAGHTINYSIYYDYSSASEIRSNLTTVIAPLVTNETLLLYHMDNDGEIITDETGTLNLGMWQTHVDGRIGEAVSFDGLANASETQGTTIFNSTGSNSWTFETWIKFLGEGTGDENLWRKGDADGGLGDQNIDNYKANNSLSYNLNSSVWYHVAQVWNNFNVSVYINGEYKFNGSWRGEGLTIINTPIDIGYYHDGTQTINASMDEVVFYDSFRTRTQVMHDALAYDITGVVGVEEVDKIATSILDAPLDAYQGTESNLTFYCNASVTGGITLENTTLNVWNSTERYYVNKKDVGGTSNQSNWSLTSIPDESYIWNCEVWDSTDTYSDWAINRTFIIDTISPSITIYSPNISVFYNDSNITLNFYAQDNVNVDSVYYSLNGAADAIVGGYANGTVLNTTLGETNYLNVYVNDTSNRIQSSNITFDSYSFTEWHTDRNIESDNVSFDLNLTYNISNVTGSMLNLSIVYNHSNDINEQNQIFALNESEGNWTALLPLGILDEVKWNANRSFYWVINYSGSERMTPNYNISIFKILVYPCNASYTTQAWNFSLKDENNKTAITGGFKSTFRNYIVKEQKRNSSFNVSNQDSFAICMYPNWTTFKTDADIEYTDALGHYPDKTYYLRKATVNNDSVENISLYLLSVNEYVKFFFNVRRGASDVANAIVTITKYRIEDGTYETIGIRKTDDDGEFIEYIDLDKNYKFSITRNGVLLGVISRNAKCTEAPCEMILQLGEAATDLWQGYYDIYATDIASNLSYDHPTKIVSFTFVDTTGTAQTIELTVHLSKYNETNLQICNNSLSSTAGTITCNLSAYSGDFVAEAWITRSPPKLIEKRWGIITTITETLGESGMIFSLFIIITAALVGAWNPAVGIALATFAFYITQILGFATFSYVSIVLVIIMAILTIIKMRRV